MIQVEQWVQMEQDLDRRIDDHPPTLQEIFALCGYNGGTESGAKQRSKKKKGKGKKCKKRKSKAKKASSSPAHQGNALVQKQWRWHSVRCSCHVLFVYLAQPQPKFHPSHHLVHDSLQEIAHRNSRTVETFEARVLTSFCRIRNVVLFLN